MSVSSNTHFQASLSQLRVCNDLFDETRSITELEQELPDIEIVAMQKLYTACNEYIKNFERMVAKPLNL